MNRRGARRRRTARERWARPIGVLAILIVAVVGFIAYRANSGLPLQSRYDVNVVVPDADRLINAADVRIGGVLVGEVLHVNAVPGSDGQPIRARVELAIDDSVGRLPVDTSVQVSPASVLGLTYVDLRLGSSRQTIPAGGTVALSRAKPSSDLTDLFQIFNRRSARGFQTALGGLAAGFAGRGTALNTTIGATAQLLPELTDVAGALAAPTTRLDAFISGYAAFTQALAPVSEQLANLIANGAATLDGLARVRPALGTAIDAAPDAESAATTAFTRVRPALTGLAQLATALRPAGGLLPGAAAQITSTLNAALPALRDVPPFARPLQTALETVSALARDPYTTGSLRKLRDLALPTDTTLSTFTPAQVHCDVFGQWGQWFGGTFGDIGDGVGPSLPNLTLTGAGALGEQLQNAKPSPNLNTNPLPNETAQECESGNEPFTGKQQLNNPAGIQNAPERDTAPPPGVVALARTAGLLRPIAGVR
jgi:virulence factor Mce-like protein